MVNVNLTLLLLALQEGRGMLLLRTKLIKLEYLYCQCNRYNKINYYSVQKLLK